MDMEKMAKKIMEGSSGDALKKLTESKDGARLAARFSGSAVEEAARRGDTAELTRLLGTILSTDEGRQFAEQVRKAMDGHGG